MSRKLFFSLALLILGAFMPLKASELTVYDGTNTNSYVPIYGYYCDAYLKCEYVIPAADLAEMNGMTITSLTWYLSSPATASWGNARFQVFLKEVDASQSTSLTAYQCTSNNLVYEGAIDGTSETITLNISPFAYHGGNLIVGVYNTVTGKDSRSSFYGVNTNGVSIQYYSYSSLDAVTTNQRNFGPKTTFVYENIKVYDRPKDVAVSGITTNSGTLSWTAGADETSWKVAIKNHADENWGNDVTVTTTSYNFTGLNIGTAYDVRVKSVYADGESEWVATKFGTKACDDAVPHSTINYELVDSYGDGWGSNQIVVRHKNGAEIATLTISSLDASLSGTLDLCYDETYEFVWVEGSYPEECSFTITDEEGVIITQHVKDNDGPSAGLLTEYTPRLPQFMRPSDIQVAVHPTTATVSWTAAGEENSWVVAYKPATAENWTEVNATTNSVNLSNLTVATLYDVRVKSVYAQGESNWLNGQFQTTICEGEENMTTINYDLTFYYQGYSWLGNKIIIRHVNGAEVAELTISDNTSHASGTVQLCYDETYEFVWVNGSYGQYCLYEFTDEDGNVIVARNETSTTPTAGVIKTYTPHPIALHKPTNLHTTEVTYNSATLAWTPGVDSTPQDHWVVVYMELNDESASYVEVSGEPTVTLTGLKDNSYYFAAVVAISGNERSELSEQISFHTPEQFPRPENVVAADVLANSASISWEGEAQNYNLRYRKAAVSDEENPLFYENFENGIDNWTAIDSDNDGNNWQLINGTTTFSSGSYPGKDGDNVVMSRSWSNDALTPDNWLISPQITLGSLLKFWVMDDGGYPETYRVYVSTTGTDPEDFEPLTDDMLTPTSSTWTEVRVDLSAYSGQTGFIAFRNYNCTDADFMFIDAVGVYPVLAPAGEWTTITSVTSPHSIDLEPSTAYQVEVQGAYDDGVSAWVGTSFSTPEATAIPENLAVVKSNNVSATVKWDGAQPKYNLRYRIQPEKNGYFEDFENGIPDDWTIIDNDGDGNVWYAVSPGGNDNYGNPRCFGDICASSASFINNVGAQHPDNWLISPSVQLGYELSVWLRGQDPSWPDENFAIYLSTNGNTVEDFIDEDGNLVNGATLLLPETTATGVLTKYTADLRSYQGTGYIAIRHFNCTDQYMLNLDNFYVQVGPEEDLPWTVVENISGKEYKIENLEPGTFYEVEVQGILDQGTTDWTEPLEFITKEYPEVTLAEALEMEDRDYVFITNELTVVATVSNVAYATDGEDNWIRIVMDDASQLQAGMKITEANGLLYYLATAPSLYYADFEPTGEMVEVTNLIKTIDMTETIARPATNSVVRVTGYYFGGELRAYSTNHGQSITLENSTANAEFEEGKPYCIIMALELKEAWAGEGAPRRQVGDYDFQNLLGRVISSQDVSTGIDDLRYINRGEVRYYDLNGRYVGTDLKELPSGIYFGTDGTKVRK